MTRVGDHRRIGSRLGAGGLWLVRYGLAGGMVVTGFVALVFNVDGLGVVGFSLGVGAGLSLMLFNWLLRVGFADHDRERDERAREYYYRHGRWPHE